MDDITAAKLWDFVLDLSGSGWDTIEEVELDDFDLEMIHEAQSNPDCQLFS